MKSLLAMLENPGLILRIMDIIQKIIIIFQVIIGYVLKMSVEMGWNLGVRVEECWESRMCYRDNPHFM